MSNEYGLFTLNQIVRLNEDLNPDDYEVCIFLVKFFVGVDNLNHHKPYPFAYLPEVRDALEVVMTLSVIDYFLNDYTNSRYELFKEFVRFNCLPVAEHSDLSLTQKVLGAIETLSYDEEEEHLEALRQLYEVIKDNYSAIELVKIMGGGEYGTEETSE